MSPDSGWFGAASPEYPQSWNLYIYALNNPLAAIDPDGYDCVYLNKDGNDVESVDSNSSRSECMGDSTHKGTGGYWVDGTATRVNLFTNSDDVGLTGYTTDANGNNKTTSSSYYTSASAPENKWLLAGLGFSGLVGTVDMIQLANYRLQHPLSHLIGASTSEVVTGCAISGGGSLALDLSPVGIVPDTIEAMQKASFNPLFNSGDNLRNVGNEVDIAEKSADALSKTLPFLGPVAKKLGPVGVTISLLKAGRDFHDCVQHR